MGDLMRNTPKATVMPPYKINTHGIKENKITTEAYKRMAKGREPAHSVVGDSLGVSGAMMGENTQKSYRFPRVIVSLTFTPIKEGERNLEGRPDLIIMNRCPALVCKVTRANDYRFVFRGGPTNVKQLSPRNVVRSYKDFMSRLDNNPYFKFLALCTNITPFLFELAMQNVNVEFDISIDYDKYIKLCGGETLFAEYNELADNIVREADKRRKARKKR